MPGMSARIKAKKGRFGVDGLEPSVRITSPATGFSIAAAGSPVATGDFTLIGTAFDDLNGDVSASIVWTSDVDGALGTGKSVAVTLSATASPVAGTVHVITASITVGADTVTDKIAVTVTP